MSGIELFECERLSARITKSACEVNRRKDDRVLPCNGCPGLGVATIIDTEDLMAHKVCSVAGCTKLAQVDGKCKAHAYGAKPRTRVVRTEPVVSPNRPVHRTCTVPGCGKHVTRQGLCWSHLKAKGIDPKTGKPFVVEVPPPAEAAADPLETFECPHCHCALSSREVEQLHCPICGKLIHTHCDVKGIPSTIGTTASLSVLPGDLSAQKSTTVNDLIRDMLRQTYFAKEAQFLADLSGMAPGATLVRAGRMVELIEGLSI